MAYNLAASTARRYSPAPFLENMRRKQVAISTTISDEIEAEFSEAPESRALTSRRLRSYFPTPIVASRWRLYRQAVDEEKRVAQDLAFKGLLEGGFQSVPFSTVGGCMKEVVTCQNPCIYWVYGGDDGARTRDLCRDRAAL